MSDPCGGEPPPPPLAAGPPAGSPAPERPAGSEGGRGRPRSRPSWLRAGLVSILVLLVGAVLGTAWFRMERAYSLRPPAVAETTDGWRVIGGPGRRFSGLALNGPRLLWQNGPSIEYLDLTSGKLRLLGPGPGMRSTWAPAVGERYAVWFEADRTGGLAAQVVAYDTGSGRRWPLADIGSVYSYPAVSGETAVWCAAAKIGEPRLGGALISTGAPFDIAPEYGTPVVSDGLVVWARGPSGPFTARELSGGRPWSVAAGTPGGELTGFALAARALVWGQVTPGGDSGSILAAPVDGGEAQAVATGVAGLVGPAFDGRTVVWAERDDDASAYRIRGRRLADGPAFTIAAVPGPVTDVAVSGDVAAWLATAGGGALVETTELP